jgi:hypothetical protein
LNRKRKKTPFSRNLKDPRLLIRKSKTYKNKFPLNIALRNESKDTAEKGTKWTGSKSGNGLAPSELLCMWKEDPMLQVCE